MVQPSRARVSLTPEPAPPPHDTRYDTCAAATAAGLGPYLRDRDPEYAWCRDDDADGTACESVEAFQVVPSTEWRSDRLVTSSKPQIRLEVSNPNPYGGSSYAHARILDGSLEIWRGLSAGGGAAPNFATVWVPDGTLADGHTYTVQAGAAPIRRTRPCPTPPSR